MQPGSFLAPAGALLSLVCASALSQDEPRIHPMAGRDFRITVGRSDTLFRIARRYDMSMSDLVRATGRAALRLRPGRHLVIPGLRILPAHPSDGIVLNVPERRAYLFQDGKLTQTHAVAVGKADWQTPLGQFHVAKKLRNPIWTPPQSMVEREGVKDDPVPPGPENPLGDRWIGWSARGVGFHSTKSPASIGGVVTHGCVRLYPKQAQALYDAVHVGTPIDSLYEPVLIGRGQDGFYLSVWPDVYHRGGADLEAVEQQLGNVGLLGAVDLALLRRIVKRAPGLPQQIIGSDLRLEVDGKPVELAIAPYDVDGKLIVPARQTVTAMGGTLTDEPDGKSRIGAGGKTLIVTAGKSEAELDGSSVTLPFTPVIAGDTLVISLRTLLDLFGARFTREWRVLRIATAPAATPAPTQPATPPAKPLVPDPGRRSGGRHSARTIRV